MTRLLSKFYRDEHGAVTVDWVVLCAAIVGLAAVAYTTIEEQTLLLEEQAAAGIETQIGQ